MLRHVGALVTKREIWKLVGENITWPPGENIPSDANTLFYITLGNLFDHPFKGNKRTLATFLFKKYGNIDLGLHRGQVRIIDWGLAYNVRPLLDKFNETLTRAGVLRGKEDVC